jgi:hypothetical protein
MPFHPCRAIAGSHHAEVEQHDHEQEHDHDRAAYTSTWIAPMKLASSITYERRRG